MANSNTRSANETETETTGRISGSCLCGAVKYSVDKKVLSANLCHCLSCKKWTGSSFIYNVWFTRSTMTLEDNSSEHLTMYADYKTHSGEVIERWFCGVCGSCMYLTRPGLDMVCLSSGTIDGVVGETAPETEEERLAGMVPVMELFCKRKASWLEVASEVQKLQEMPGGGAVDGVVKL